MLKRETPVASVIDGRAYAASIPISSGAEQSVNAVDSHANRAREVLGVHELLEVGVRVVPPRRHDPLVLLVADERNYESDVWRGIEEVITRRS